MPQNYTPEFKKKIVRLRLEEGRTIKSITTEYGIAKETLRTPYTLRKTETARENFAQKWKDVKKHIVFFSQFDIILTNVKIIWEV